MSPPALAIFVLAPMSLVLRVLLGERHRVILVPGLIGCAIGFADDRGTNWQWPWLALALALLLLMGWLAVDWRKRHPSAP